MTVYELLTHDVPYRDIEDPYEATTQISKGLLPPRPEYSTNSEVAKIERFMWSLCERCWNLNPKLRPSMAELEKDVRDFITATCIQTGVQVCSESTL